MYGVTISNQRYKKFKFLVLFQAWLSLWALKFSQWLLWKVQTSGVWHCIVWYRCTNKSHSMGQASRAAAWAPTHKGHQDVTRITGNMVLVNWGFHIGKNFFKNYQQFGYTPSEVFVNPVLSCKNLNNIGLNGHKIISLPMVPTCLRPVLVWIVTSVRIYHTAQNHVTGKSSDLF